MVPCTQALAVGSRSTSTSPAENLYTYLVGRIIPYAPIQYVKQKQRYLGYNVPLRRFRGQFESKTRW